MDNNDDSSGAPSEMSILPTPITDAAAFPLESGMYSMADSQELVVLAEDARKLERENSALRSLIKLAHGNIDGCLAGDDLPSVVIRDRLAQAIGPTP